MRLNWCVLFANKHNGCVLFGNKHSGNASKKIAKFIKYLLLDTVAVSYVASHTTCPLMLPYWIIAMRTWSCHIFCVLLKQSLLCDCNIHLDVSSFNNCLSTVCVSPCYPKSFFSSSVGLKLYISRTARSVAKRKVPTGNTANLRDNAATSKGIARTQRQNAVPTQLTDNDTSGSEFKKVASGDNL